MLDAQCFDLVGARAEENRISLDGQLLLFTTALQITYNVLGFINLLICVNYKSLFILILEEGVKHAHGLLRNLIAFHGVIHE